MTACFDEILAIEVPTPGTEERARRVRVEFTIDEFGLVRDLVTSGDYPAIEPCIVRVLSRMHFSPAPPDGPVRYATEFVFAVDDRVRE